MIKPPPIPATRKELINWTLETLTPREMAERLVIAREVHCATHNELQDTKRALRADA